MMAQVLIFVDIFSTFDVKFMLKMHFVYCNLNDDVKIMLSQTTEQLPTSLRHLNQVCGQLSLLMFYATLLLLAIDIYHKRSL